MPTIHAALQICEQNEVTQIADIIIYLIEISDSLRSDFEKIFSEFPIRFVAVPDDLTQVPAGVIFNKTHVPRSTLVRLSIGSLIPSQYNHIIYLDGDIQIVGDIKPMISYDVPVGKIAAASDASWLYRGDFGNHWKSTRNYLSSLGISNPQDYFNAGVLLFRRETWLTSSIEAWNFYIQNSSLCLYHDQSALNAVFLGQREVISPLYNFVSGYSEMGIQYFYPPRLIHFTGGDKPWFRNSWPWHGKFVPGYKTLLSRFTLLQQFSPLKDIDDNVASGRNQKIILSIMQPKSPLRLPWRMITRNIDFSSYMRKTKFVF